MRISEKHIMHLIHIATEFKRELLQFKMNANLSDQRPKSLDEVNMILQIVFNQQSEELKVIE
jgi:hypothetical protein